MTTKDAAQVSAGVEDPLSFEMECVKAARTFGRDGKVKVVFEGAAAGTDGDTILLPALDRAHKLTGDQVRIGRGFVDHEAAHILHTDHKKWDPAMRRLGDWGGKLLNALEDIRIERIVLDSYVGAKENLTATTEFANSKVMKEHPKGDPIYKNPQDVLPILATWLGRVEGLGYESPSTKACLDEVPDELKDIMRPFVEQALNASNTEEIIQICDEVIDHLKNNPPPSGGGSGRGRGGPGGMGTGGGSGAAGEGGGSGGGKGKGEGEGEGEEPAQDYGIDEGDPTKDGAEAQLGQGGAGAGDGPKKNKDAMRDQVEQSIKQPIDFNKKPMDVAADFSDVFKTASDPKVNSYLPMTTRFDKWHTKRPTSKIDDPRYDYSEQLKVTPSKLTKYNSIKKQLQGEITVMARKIERALMSVRRQDFQSGKLEGRLDPRSFVSVVSQANPFAFKQRGESKALNTAVSIVVDFSGSMGGHKAQLAQQATIALGLVLERMGLPWECLGFDCSSGVHYGGGKDFEKYKEMVSKLPSDKNFRTDPIDMWLLKEFDEPLRNAIGALGVMDGLGRGNNCDGESIDYAYQRLKKRREPRKVMLVLSDGYPAAAMHFGPGKTGSGRQPLYQHLRQVVRNIERSKVDIVGIGICSDAVKNFYRKHVVLNDPAEIGKTMMDQVAKLLLGQRFKASNKDLFNRKKEAA
jgi:cobaltochelatase CobT